MPSGRSTRGVHRHLLVTIFAASAFMTALDVFIVNVGLPELGRDVGQGSLNDLSWVLNAYTIVFAALLVPAGRLGTAAATRGRPPMARWIRSISMGSGGGSSGHHWR
jgi:MFS family permease